MFRLRNGAVSRSRNCSPRVDSGPPNASHTRKFARKRIPTRIDGLQVMLSSRGSRGRPSCLAST